MSKFKMWVAILAVFLCGVLVGAVGGGMVVRHKAKAAFEKFRKDDGSLLVKIMMKGLDRELKLTDEQRRNILPILEETTKDLKLMRQEIHARLKVVLSRTVNGIKEHLSNEQKDELDELVREIHLHRLLLPPPQSPPN